MALNFIRDVHHVAIICSDYQRSKRFYTEILGCAIIRETYREARQSYKLDLQVGDPDATGHGVAIELFSFPDPPPRPNAPEAQGLRHLSFAVDDLEGAIAHLNQAGVDTEPIRLDELTDKRFTFFKDPDGLPLELYER
ncbi:MAG: VOC family protein [Leptolyngbyaceae cyanobacterium]